MLAGLIEHENGTPLEGSLQMLTFAQGLAGRLGTDLAAFVIGEEGRALAGTLKSFGVERIFLIKHELLDVYAPEARGRAVFQLMREKEPSVVLAAATDRGNEIMAHAAALADLPLAANCADVHPGDPFRVTRLRWGSSLLEDAVLHGEPRLITLGLDQGEAAPSETPGAGALEEFAPDLEEKDLRVRVSKVEEIVVEGITLKNAPVVVGGGRGVGGEDKFAVLEELAGLLGGAVGCSRVVTNNGWRPHSDQVGLTGTRIAPELYIACGVSGAIQHLVGCKGAGKIMVINNDPEAPFFTRADYGVLGDLHEVLRAVIDEVRKAKA